MSDNVCRTLCRGTSLALASGALCLFSNRVTNKVESRRDETLLGTLFRTNTATILIKDQCLGGSSIRALASGEEVFFPVALAGTIIILLWIYSRIRREGRYTWSYLKFMMLMHHVPELF